MKTAWTAKHANQFFLVIICLLVLVHFVVVPIFVLLDIPYFAWVMLPQVVFLFPALYVMLKHDMLRLRGDIPTKGQSGKRGKAPFLYTRKLLRLRGDIPTKGQSEKRGNAPFLYTRKLLRLRGDIPTKGQSEKRDNVPLPNIVFAVLFAVLALPIAAFISELSAYIFPNDIGEVLADGAETLDFAFMFVLFAVLPSVCEELLFRGVYLHGFRNTSPIKACLINGLAFSAAHFNLHQGIYAFFFGTAVAYMVYLTGSVLMGFFTHITFNGANVGLAYLPLESPEAAEVVSGGELVDLFVIALVCAVVGLVLFREFVVYNKRAEEAKEAKEAQSEETQSEETQAEESEETQNERVFTAPFWLGLGIALFVAVYYFFM
ncbi:MAG: CPBP family intramembrane metalloprotease [Defluviitaleaceae bacterium]|nr:CPBP family intramembrane metalloprotease [Defluviitaleaceae bacterium]